MDGTTRTQIVDLSSSVTDTNWQIQGAGDFDEAQVDPNGMPVPRRDEIVWRNYSTGETAIRALQRNGTTGKYDNKPGASGFAYFQTVDPSWKLQGIGDFNNDQKPDFVWRNASSGANAIWLLNGVSSNSNGSLSANPILDAGYFYTLTDQNWQMRGATDFNGDGKSDVLWQNVTTGENATWYMDGTNVLGGSFSSGIANNSWLPRAGANTPWRSSAPYQFYETNPVVSAGLVNDTALSGTNTDLITRDPTITVQVTGARTTSVLKAGLGTDPVLTIMSVLNPITTTLPANGQFTVSRTQLQQLNGGTPLADGTYTLALQAQDNHLNQSRVLGLTFTLDTQAPTIGSTLTLAPSSDTGRSNSDKITSQKTPLISGTAEANTTVQVFDGAQIVGQATTSTTGTWQVTTSLLADGPHSLTAKAFDAAGNVSPATTPLALTIDSQVAAPTGLKLTPGSDTGTSSTDNITNQPQPTLTGTGEALAQVTVKEGTTVLGTTTTDATGTWQVSPTTALTAGTHTLTATAVDVAGNTSAGATLAVLVDPIAPTLTLTNTFTNATLNSMSRLAGTLSDASSGVASLKYRWGTGTDIPVPVAANGTFDQAFSFVSAPIGATTLTITGVDVAGNTVSTTYNVTIPADTQAPTISASFDSSTINQPKIVAQVTDDRGVQGLQAGFSQTQLSNIAIDPATGKYIIDLKQLNGGLALSPGTNYTVYLQAKDTSNNVSPLQSVQVYFADPTKPINIPISSSDGTTSGGQLQLAAPNASNGPKDSTTNQPYTGPIFIQQTPGGEIKIDIGKAVCGAFTYIPPVSPINPASSQTRPANRYDYKLYFLGGGGTADVAIGGGNFVNNQLTINQFPGIGGVGLKSGTYLLAPDYVPVKALSEIDANPDENCVACRSRKQFNADASVELHSGAVLKSENLVSYQSQDQTHTWGLSYNSLLRADARPIVHFGYDDIGSNIKDNYRMTGLLTVKTNGGTVVSEGYTSDLGVPGAKVGENYWKIPTQGGGLQGALQVDMRSQASGVYDYDLETGIKVLCPCQNLVGESTTLHDKLVVVNGSDSDFGTGWGLAGLQRIYETTTHDTNNGQLEYNALLVDGDGSYTVFRSLNGINYASSNGDFSVLTKQNGTFSRITKDGTAYAFNTDNVTTQVEG